VKFSEVMIHYDYKQSNVARALGVSRQVIYSWHKKNKIPFSKQCEIEILTKGALKARKED
jgi:DNA-binding XRE family transcriptional regulator